jgi:two-component system, LytTR family, response regulator
MTVRALLVDDEEPARELLRAFLARWPEVAIVGEAGDGRTAVELTTRLAPDLLFLDVQMPRENGFDVVAALDPDTLPLIVFVTAYDQYALRAFEVSAVDYLLKPFDADRFGITMRRVLARCEEPAHTTRDAVRALLTAMRPAGAGQLVVRIDGRHVFLDPGEIEWVEAVRKDARLHLGARSLLVREPMSSLERRLDPAHFLRVHRSAIVNRTHIREMQPWFKGDYVFIMRTGARVVSGETYRDAVRRLIDHG